MQKFAPSVKIPALPALSSEQKTLLPITPGLKIVFKFFFVSLLDTCIMYVYKKIQKISEPDLSSKNASKIDLVL
jgi:hypothetical protein